MFNELSCKICVKINIYVILILFLATAFSFNVNAYEAGIGHLPSKKAKADAQRISKIISDFEDTTLKGKCVYTVPKKGMIDMLGLLNEEGRGYSPPRSGYEGVLYKKIKQALLDKKNIDLEEMMKMSLEACVNEKGEVYLQDAFLTAHNVLRILARPETWWSDGSWEWQKDLSGIGLGSVKISPKRWHPGWRGMVNDPVFPIIKDIVGHESIVSETPTMAEILGVTIGDSTPKYQKYKDKNDATRKERIEKLQSSIDDLKSKIYFHERKQIAMKQVHALKRTNQWASDYEYHTNKINEYNLKIADLSQELGYRKNEFELDITRNVTDIRYTQRLFSLDADHKLFHPLYGAEDDEGNGGNWYYYWLGAFVESAGSRAAVIGGSLWETGQLSEHEKGRKGIQISHFEGGGTLSEFLRANSIACIKRMQEAKKRSFITSRHQQSDWYCTNRPVIDAPVALPPVISSAEEKKP